MTCCYLWLQLIEEVQRIPDITAVSVVSLQGLDYFLPFSVLVVDGHRPHLAENNIEIKNT
jgi:hypothetical protein